MNNNRGSILVITLGFVVVFTMLGIASLYMAMVHNEAAERQKASAQAFWLADGVVEKAKEKLPGTHLEEVNVPMGNVGEYSVQTTKLDGFSHRWIVEASAKVRKERRSITALIDRFNVPPNAVSSDEELEHLSDDVIIPAEQINEHTLVSFSNYFNRSEHQVLYGEDVELWSDENAIELLDNSLSVVKIETEPRVELYVTNEEHQEYAYLTIVDVRTINEVQKIIPEVVIKNGLYRGIVWIIGDAKLVDPEIEGSVVADGALSIYGKGGIAYDALAVDQALNHLGNNLPGKKTIVLWDET